MNAERDNLSRRHFLKTTALSTAVIIAGRAASFGSLEQKEEKKIPIGVQLYSLRGLGSGGRGGSRGGSAMEVPATFEGIKKLGYDGVEFAGYYGYDNKAEDIYDYEVGG